MLDHLGSKRRVVMIGASGVAVLLLVFALTRLAGGGGKDPFDDLPDAVASGVVTPAPTPTALPAPTSTAMSPVAPPGSPPSAADHHGDSFETTSLRDPFCPLVTSVASGTAGVNCPEQSPPVAGEPMELLDVFLDKGIPHARARLGPRVFTLHVNDAFGDYRVVALAETCGEFTRGAERQSLCEGARWGAPAPGAATP